MGAIDKICPESTIARKKKVIILHEQIEAKPSKSNRSFIFHSLLEKNQNYWSTKCIVTLYDLAYNT